MSQVSEALEPESLSALQAEFRAVDMETLFKTVMANRYPPTQNYVDTLLSLFHNDQPLDSQTTDRLRVSEEDRERCIIAILASRGAIRNLGIHIYAALMLGIRAEEIADVIFLGGIYSGVPAVADGLDTEVKVLQKLNQLVVDEEYRMTFAPKVDPPARPELPKLDVTTVFAMLSKELQL